MDSRSLYEGCVAGSATAWSEVSSYAAAAILSRFHHPKIPMDDLLGEVRLHLVESALDKVVEPDAFKTFLWRTAQNVARAKLRLKHVSQEYLADADDDVSNPLARTPAAQITIDRH